MYVIKRIIYLYIPLSYIPLSNADNITRQQSYAQYRCTVNDTVLQEISKDDQDVVNLEISEMLTEISLLKRYH